MINIEFDAAKDEENCRKHGVSLALAEDFEWETAIFREDDRMDYGEQRFQAIGYIGNRMFVFIYCLTPTEDEDDETVRAISLRHADSKEIRRYAET